MIDVRVRSLTLNEIFREIVWQQETFGSKSANAMCMTSDGEYKGSTLKSIHQSHARSVRSDEPSGSRSKAKVNHRNSSGERKIYVYLEKEINS